MNIQQKIPLLKEAVLIFNDTVNVIKSELRTMFKDRGVVIMLVLAPLAYPILYCSLYKSETLIDVPMAAVDCSRSQESRELLRHLDATQSLHIAGTYSTLAEAKQAYNEQKVHGVVYIPADFSKNLNTGHQTTVSIYADISSFMYYRIINQACSNCVLDMSNQIQVKRLNANGITGEPATIVSNPIPYEGVVLYNEGAGFASFLMPSVLILIIFQTLFLGIGIIAGTSRGENRFHVLVSSSVHRGGTIRVILGKGFCYFVLYAAWSFFVLMIIPRVFNLPHIGIPYDIMMLMVPFLLASVFFSMTISVFMPHRETSMIIFMFMSLILLFLSGVSWPQSNINGFWKTFSWILPSTNGTQGYIKINTMGADLQHISFEYISLWIQTVVYFATTYWAYRWQIEKSSRKSLKTSEI
ncbi:MAG: ABC transporter permease [Bacteroidota bacterium]|nr:ABC transporter permease [Bacteroidota bacterium]